MAYFHMSKGNGTIGSLDAFSLTPDSSRQRLGWIVTMLFEVIAETPAAQAVPAGNPKKHRWLPVLVVLFLISYSLMVMLIVEQGQTIESQRVLIRELFRDNTELSSVKLKSAAPQDSPNSTLASSLPSTQASSTQNPSTQVPAVKAPSSQAQSSQVPASRSAQQHRTQSQASKMKSEFQMPTRPASDVADNARSLRTI
jgi:hypothetical protein